MSKLLAIDGFHILRRVFEANPETDPGQKAEAAIRNTLSSFRRLLSSHAPTHVLPAFDAGGHTWRHDLYPAYRAGRAPIPTELSDRLPEFFGMLENMGLHVVSVPGVGAGDVIATSVLRWLSEGRGEAIVASTDKDLHVLVEHGARVWDHFKSEWHDAAWVEAKFGVSPAQLAEYLALTGEAADGVPGVTNIGRKKAAQLLRAYGTLDGVMAGAGILKDALGEKLRREKAQAYLSRELVSLKTDATLGVTWKMLAFTPDAGR
ncbi:MAG: 5-3 exonuclease [Herminiimonas sp.]|nr:5-3 exonuclease [Herminiimonas sp.]